MSDQIQRHGDEVICTVRFSECEPVEEDDDDQKLHARREVPCASPPVDEDDDVTNKKGKKRAKKKAKKKAITLSSVVGAKIIEDQLSAQDPSNTPEDWNTPGKYHPACVTIWKAWLNFVPVFLDKQTIDGSVLHLGGDKFFSALKDSFQTCCHPEFLLNERYRNEHTKQYAKLWDEIYSEIRSYFGNPDNCTQANNIIIKLEGSVSFELLKRAAEEKNARTSVQMRDRMRDLAERGEHPWQQPDFINAHRKRTSEQMRDLVERGVYWFQQPEFIEANSKRMRDLVARREHLFQQPEFINANSERSSERARELVTRREHLFQQPEYKQQHSEDVKRRRHDLRMLSSGSTEEATYYAIDGADENGRYILIPEIFGTNDLNFRKRVGRQNGKKTTIQFHAMEAIDELYLRKCSAKTCTNKMARCYMNCNTCLGYRTSGGKATD